VIKVNQKTLTQFEGADFDALTRNLASVLRDDMLKTHLEEFCQLWAGKAQFTSQTVKRLLDGVRGRHRRFSRVHQCAREAPSLWAER
jgi:hypothetical protein